MSSKRRAATPSALLTAVVFLAPSTVTTTTTAQSQSNCVSYTSSSTAGNLWDESIANPSYFGCADDGFLVAVEASYVGPVDALSWTCSGGDVVGSFSSGSVAEGSMSFTVGITEVKTRVTAGGVGYLSDMFFGGYDVDSTWNDIFFASKGPVGSNNEGSVLLPDPSGSYCGDDTFASGVTVWSSFDGFVLGIVLECTYVTAACAPPNYPTGLLDDTSGSGTDSTTPSPSPAADTDTPGASPNTVSATESPNSSEDTAPSRSTPSPSGSTSSGADAPSASDGTGPAFTTPSPSVSTSSGAGAPSPSASTVPVTGPPSSSPRGTGPPTNLPSSSTTTSPATTGPPSSPGGDTGAATDPPSSSGGAVSATDPPGSSSGGGSSAVANTPSPSANSALSTSGGGSSSPVSTMVIAGVSAAGAVLLLAMCVAVSCGLYRRGARRARHPQKPWDTFGTPVRSAGRGSEGSHTPEGEGGGGGGGGGGVAYASEAGSSSTRGLPPAYAEPPI